MFDVRCSFRSRSPYAVHQIIGARLSDAGIDVSKTPHLFCIDPLHEGQVLLRIADERASTLGQMESIPDICAKNYDFCMRVSPVRHDSSTQRRVPMDINDWQKSRFDEKQGVFIQQLFTRSEQIYCERKSGFWLPSAIMIGRLRVLDPFKVIAMIQTGVGRHKAFGFGLLQLFPV